MNGKGHRIRVGIMKAITLRYRADEDVGLDMHEDFCMPHPDYPWVHFMPLTVCAVNSSWQDDSDITLNACLGKVWATETGLDWNFLSNNYRSWFLCMCLVKDS